MKCLVLKWFLSGLIVILFFILAPKAHATTFTFTTNTTADTIDATPGDGLCADSGGACSLRAAIEEANILAVAFDNEIYVSAGTYLLSSNLPLINQSIYQPSNITILGSSATSTIINGGDNYFAFMYNPGNDDSTITIKNLTIRQTLPPEYGSSGAVGVFDGNANMENLVLTDNIGFNFYAAEWIFDNTYSVTIKNVIAKNSQNGNGPGYNLAGGFSIVADRPNTTIAIENASIVNNSADNFIGIYGVKTISGVIKNTTIANNTSTSDMVAILAYLEDSDLSIVNTTIVNNSGTGPGVWFGSDGSGIFADDHKGDGSGNIKLKNVLLDNNRQNNNVANCASVLSIISQGGNLSSDNSCSSKFNQPTDKNNVDPLLGSLTNFDDFNSIYTLQASSPAINTGVASGAPSTDQRGVSRPQGSAVDIGAYEYQSSSDTSSNNNNSGSNPVETLPTVGAYAILVPVGLAFLTTFGYIVWDWLRHRRPLVQADPNISYSLSHHIKVVTVPVMAYRVRVFFPQRRA